MNPNVEKAARMIDAFNPLPYILNRNDAVARDLASRLDSAGLLVTPLHERALEACDEFAGAVLNIELRSHGAKVRDIGRESLAAKQARQPVARWVVKKIGPSFVVLDGHDCVDTNRRFSGGPSQAVAVANALNALEDKP
jgi:hypothetical protein